MTPVHQLTPEQAVQELEQLEDQGLPANPKERQAHQARKDELTAWILMHPQTKEPPMPAATTPEQKLATIKARFDATGDSKEAWAARMLCKEHGLVIPPWAEKRGPARGPRGKKEPLQIKPARAFIADEVDEPTGLAPDLPPAMAVSEWAERHRLPRALTVYQVREARSMVWKLLVQLEVMATGEREALLPELRLLQSATTTATLLAQGEVG